MRQAILDFPKQFAFSPVVEHPSNLVAKPYALLSGMGGSHLAADILKAADPSADLFVHSDYGLPAWPKNRFDDTLFLASSYSGNTEETLDAYETAGRLGMARAAISIGGRLLEMARRDGVPFVQLPDTGIQPRSALGFSLIGLVKLLGRNNLLPELAALSESLDVERIEEPGRELARALKGRVPVVYASQANEAVLANWKRKLNETGKTPAFVNVFPELNHNEMTGFDTRHRREPPSEGFSFVFLVDTEDHPRIQKRMEVTVRLYRVRGYDVREAALEGATRFERIFNSLLLADWTALALAERYGLESEKVPMVEEFKMLMSVS